MVSFRLPSCNLLQNLMNSMKNARQSSWNSTRVSTVRQILRDQSSKTKVVTKIWVVSHVTYSYIRNCDTWLWGHELVHYWQRETKELGENILQCVTVHHKSTCNVTGLNLCLHNGKPKCYQPRLWMLLWMPQSVT